MSIQTASTTQAPTITLRDFESPDFVCSNVVPKIQEEATAMEAEGQKLLSRASKLRDFASDIQAMAMMAAATQPGTLCMNCDRPTTLDQLGTLVHLTGARSCSPSDPASPVAASRPGDLFQTNSQAEYR